jgi:hypothetical protein
MITAFYPDVKKNFSIGSNSRFEHAEEEKPPTA